MTDYVSEVAELLREHSWQRVDTMGRVTCASENDEHIYTGIDHEQHQAEVLAAADLLPTSVEWGVRGVETGLVHDHHDGWTEDVARDQAAYDGWTLVSRPVHDWKDATDD